MAHGEGSSWYGVRCLFQHGPGDGDSIAYEERITIWWAGWFDEAIELAEAEAAEYAADIEGVSDLGLVQAYVLPEPPGQGVEVFSLIRDSGLTADDYIDQFFDTGGERRQAAG
ncbi:hypothetical protein [Modestobacter altitudinis]|uniref:hypothetical protein n=1 Tax=Modestobacter altitudinis TaxID=2213158 RepID=UPI00110CFB8C|nr:hypothetical protein [Modestobacter altitudinis]